MAITKETDQNDSDSNLFGSEIEETDMNAAGAMQTTIAGLVMAYIGMHRLVKTLPSDETAKDSDVRDVIPHVTDKVNVLLPNIKFLAEWLESVNHAMFDMCIHAPKIEGAIQWSSVTLSVSSSENGMHLADLMDMITAQLN